MGLGTPVDRLGRTQNTRIASDTRIHHPCVRHSRDYPICYNATARRVPLTLPRKHGVAWHSAFTEASADRGMSALQGVRQQR